MGGAARVLIFDDDPDVVVYLSSLLEDNGYEVEARGDTRRALDALAQFQPHLVLLDVLLPGRSGLDLLVRIRESERFGGVPLVLVTGDDAVIGDGARSYMSAHPGVRGPDHVLGKPIEVRVFLEVVARLTS
jgi:CheY-like chemotaxis protein